MATQNIIQKPTQEMLMISFTYFNGSFSISEVKNIKGYLPQISGSAEGYSFSVLNNSGKEIFSVTKDFPEKIFYDDFDKGMGGIKIKDPSSSYIIIPAPEYTQKFVIKDKDGKEVLNYDIAKYIIKSGTETKTPPPNFFAKNISYIGGGIFVVLLVVAFIYLIRRKRAQSYKTLQDMQKQTQPAPGQDGSQTTIQPTQNNLVAPQDFYIKDEINTNLNEEKP